MPAGPYSPCPGGTGNDIKFCCGGDLLGELQKIERMLDGEQYLACLQHIDRLLKDTPDKACLLATKTMVLRVLQRAEETDAAEDEDDSEEAEEAPAEEPAQSTEVR